MKKGWKIAGTIAGLAALAAVLPHSCRKDEENDKLTVQALLWKYTNQPDHETPGNRNVSIDIGFHNPFAEENDDLLMDDEDDLILLDSPAAVEVEAAPQCDIELTLEPKLDDEPEAPAQPEL